MNPYLGRKVQARSSLELHAGPNGRWPP